MPWDCLFYQCRHNQIFPLLSSGGFESSGLFTERQRGNRRYVEGGSISSSTYLAAKPTLDPLETLQASKHVILAPQTRRGAAERLNLALLTQFCLLSIMQGVMPGQTPLACYNQPLYELGMKAGKKCPTSLGQGTWERGCCRQVHHHSLGLAWASTPLSHSSSCHQQLLCASQLLVINSDGSPWLGLGVGKTRRIIAHTLPSK